MSGQKMIHPAGGEFQNTSVAAKTPRQVDGYEASAAITGPKVVALAAAGTVSTMGSGSAAITALGVCVNSPATGQTAQVVTDGVVTSVPCDGTVSANSALIRSNTTDGSVKASTSPAVGEVIGYALAASASNVVTMKVCKSI